MQLPLSFLVPSPPEGAAPVWAALDDEQRADVVAILARLMAQVAIARETDKTLEKESHDAGHPQDHR